MELVRGGYRAAMSVMAGAKHVLLGDWSGTTMAFVAIGIAALGVMLIRSSAPRR
ncbi:MAG TPA: hypothetical protein VFQ38_21505 [Longimicrobiales bacterium]|nr:hypothetical protein [Longimicrobiales bacterium]